MLEELKQRVCGRTVCFEAWEYFLEKYSEM